MIVGIIKKMDDCVKPYLSEEDIYKEKLAIGENAGICYSSKSLSERQKEDNNKKESRFNRVAIESGHPVTEHSVFTLSFERISKLQAMVLEAFHNYSALEQSARYTNLEDRLEGKEKELYIKWIGLFTDILSKDDNLDSKRIRSLARENARYIVSIYSPYANLIYTANLRMWSIIVASIDTFKKKCHIAKVVKDLAELADAISYALGELIDLPVDKVTADRLIHYFSIDTDSDASDTVPKFKYDEIIDIAYSRYFMSIASFAQEQRHRTIIHKVSVLPTDVFYTPAFIRNTGLEDIWLEDMNLANTYGTPQGKLILVEEVSDKYTLALKLRKRTCVHAQKEIRDIAKVQSMEFFSSMARECGECNNAKNCPKISKY